MVDPPAWNPALYAKRHHVENLFSRMKDWGRIALRRDKTRQSWMGFAYLAAAMINLRIAEFSHRAYNYGQWDEVLSRPVIPEPGDRLSLMRRPDNPADGHATEVWWRDGHHLGHVPRDVAAEIAPKLDAGTACRAYVLDPGDGRAWSLRMVLVGPAVGDLHRREVAGGLQRAAAAASEAVWGLEDATGVDPYARPGGSQGFDGWGGGEGSWRRSPRPKAPPPTQRQRAASEAWDARRAAAREAREAALIYAMHLLPEPRPPLPRANRQRDFAEGADAVPDEALRGQTFPWWDQVPP